MNRIDIRELRIHVTYPALSLVMSCDHKKITEAFLGAVEQIGKDNLVEHIVDRFDELIKKIVCSLNSYQVAIFINKYIARFYVLTCPVEEYVYIGSTFKIDPITASLNRQNRAWVLDYSHKASRLLEAHETDLVDVTFGKSGFDSNNPFALPKGHRALCQAEFAKLGAACTYKNKKEYWKSLDEYLDYYLTEDSQPLIVVASLEMQDEISEYSSLIPKIDDRVSSYGVLKNSIENIYEKRFKKYYQEINNALYETDPLKLLISARLGHLRLLMVEKGYRLHGCERNVSRLVSQSNQCTIKESSVEVVDLIIEATCGKGGTVVVAPDDSLMNYGRIVGMVR